MRKCFMFNNDFGFYNFDVTTYLEIATTEKNQSKCIQFDILKSMFINNKILLQTDVNISSTNQLFCRVQL